MKLRFIPYYTIGLLFIISSTTYTMNQTGYLRPLIIRGKTVNNLPAYVTQDDKNLAKLLAGSRTLKHVVDCGNSTLRYVYETPGKIDVPKKKELPPASYTQFPQVKKFILKNTPLSQIEWASFLGFNNLVVLDLSHNKIITLGMNAFKDLKKLKTLNLSYNQISHIDSNAFIDLKELKTLLINNNQLTLVNIHAFKTLRHLETINISENLLDCLNKQMVRLILLYSNIKY